MPDIQIIFAISEVQVITFQFGKLSNYFYTAVSEKKAGPWVALPLAFRDR
jgi:hypothetical protein